MDLTRPNVEAHIALLKPDLIFFDFAQWIPTPALTHGAKSVFYATESIVRFAYINHKARNLPPNRQLTEADLLRPPPGFPCPDMRLQAAEARALAHGCRLEFEIEGGMSLMRRLNVAFQECDAIAVKTCRELEGPCCDFLEKHTGKPVLLSGPMIPKPLAGVIDDNFDRWLRGFGNSSVVYCALGSECVLKKEQFQELVLGLELTGMAFLAALKPPTDCEDMESALPQGFSERTKERGIIHGGWVQQPLILQHPFIGCFVTHCGLGSLAEAIMSECQLVLLPKDADQFINARRMSMDFKIGVEIEKRECHSFFTREAVCGAILLAMHEESLVRNELRANHVKLREFVLQENLEESYMTEFIENVQGLIEK